MAERPNFNIAWATDNSALKSETTDLHKTQGWTIVDGIGEKPNLNEVNYWRNAVYNLFEYLEASQLERENQLAALDFKIDNVQSGPDENGLGGVGYDYSNEDSDNLVLTALDTFTDEADATPTFVTSEDVAVGDLTVSKTTVNINTSSEDMDSEVLVSYDNANDTYATSAVAPNENFDLCFSHGPLSKTSEFGDNLAENLLWQSSDYVDTGLENTFKWFLKPANVYNNGYTVMVGKFNKATGKYDDPTEIHSGDSSKYYNLLSSSVERDHLALLFVTGANRFANDDRSFMSVIGHEIVIINVRTGAVADGFFSTTGVYGGSGPKPATLQGGGVNVMGNIKLQRDLNDNLYFSYGYMRPEISGQFTVRYGKLIERSNQDTVLAVTGTNNFVIPLSKMNPTCWFGFEDLPPGSEEYAQYDTRFDFVTTSHIDDAGDVFFSTAYVDMEYTKNTLSKADLTIKTVKISLVNVDDFRITYYGNRTCDIKLYIFGNILGPADHWWQSFGLNIRAFCTHSSGGKIRYNLGWRVPLYRAKQSMGVEYFNPNTDVNYLSFQENALTTAAGNIIVEHAHSFPYLGGDGVAYADESSSIESAADYDYFSGAFLYGPIGMVLLKEDGTKRTYQMCYYTYGSNNTTNSIITDRIEVDGTSVVSITDTQKKVDDFPSSDPDRYRFDIKSSMVVCNDAVILNSLSDVYAFRDDAVRTGMFSEVMYRPGFFVFYRSNVATVGNSIAKTLYFNFDPTDAESFFNTFNKPDYNGINASSGVTDFANYTVTPSPTITANNAPVEGHKYGYVLCKFYSLEDYPVDKTYSFYSPVFKQYKAFAASVQYVQDALDDLYRQLSSITALQAFGGTETSSTFNSVISGLVGSNRHEETGVVLSANQVYTVNHNLNQQLVTISVYDDATEEEVSVFTELKDANSLEISSTAPLTVSLVVIK